MLESVPPLVEAVIYCYFVAVAAVGCYLHGRLWVAHRRTEPRTGTDGDESPRPSG